MLKVTPHTHTHHCWFLFFQKIFYLATPQTFISSAVIFRSRARTFHQSTRAHFNLQLKPKVETYFSLKGGYFYWPPALFCGFQQRLKQAKFILDFPREPRLQSRILLPVQLFVWGKREGKKEKALCSYCWILTSASGLWQRAAAEGCCLIVRVCGSGTGLCYDDLYCSLISSLGFPLASSPLTHPSSLLCSPP